ncbi:hypothetical protein [Corynebacterium anserum]|uniref:Uncharacterized protein n=1 Tax=Corynebacterium anserum TaxID=2684406 RepID=A0A7G7YPZ9_9CORY|nr:hypothetical protein [Corynebacterium anserum]MBC2682223.1 hypothetical protein [Corynebacterium anserum]QNH96569.1 hypothetical protein GP473_07765 [Corynebacterium anserum]
MTSTTHIVNEAWRDANDPTCGFSPPAAVPRPSWWKPVPGDSILNGALGTTVHGGRRHRRIPSAGGLYPIAVVDIHPETLTLALRWWVTSAKYGHRGWISSLLDAGHALAALEIHAGLNECRLESVEVTPPASMNAAPQIHMHFASPMPRPALAWAGPVGEDVCVVHNEPTTPDPTGEILAAALGGCQGESYCPPRGSYALSRGIELPPLGHDPALAQAIALISTEDSARRQSGQWNSPCPPVPLWLLEALAPVLPVGSVIQQLSPDGLWSITSGGPEPAAAGDAREMLSQWCGDQEMVSTAGGIVTTTAPVEWLTNREAAINLLEAGRRIHCAHMLCTRYGFASRPIAGWVGADVGTAVHREPALISHALAIGPREHDATQVPRPLKPQKDRPQTERIQRRGL